jgi:murein DD-endopeptidase MepM/ murein hydrolase activator NlpD
MRKIKFNPILKTLGIALFASTITYFSYKTFYKPSNTILNKEEKCYDNLADNHYFGFDGTKYEAIEGKLGKNELFNEVLSNYNVAENKISTAFQALKGKFDTRKFRQGNNYTLLRNKKTGNIEHAIYEKDMAEYLVLNFADFPDAEVCYNPTEVVQRQVSGVIEGSLWQTMDNHAMSQEIAVKMAEIFRSVLDFRKIQRNDKFKIIYDQTNINGDPYDAGNIYAVELEHKGETYSAYGFENNGEYEYYDYKGNSLKRMFLKSPLKFSRITSRFNPNRFHPVLRVLKAHKGTDFAAPYGTPILATASGKVIEQKYTRGNGNYVKIQHNNQYTTQYLHMSRFAGLRVGSQVKQGQVIGYVGSTGLATGPHVCYRFWKNGQQIDPLRSKLPFGVPLNKNQLTQFYAVRDKYKSMLDQLMFENKDGLAYIDVIINEI